jgi:hypothetical protein
LVWLSGSVTRRFVKKAPNFKSPNIAQNGALLNKNFCAKDISGIFFKFKAKKYSQNLVLI